MCDDVELLRSYVESGSEAAFTALVERHCGLVFQAALRQVGGNAAIAEDVTQSVFTLLAQKARSLVRHPNLAGWLFSTTHFVSVRAIRSEFRRRQRETAAVELAEVNQQMEAEWNQIRPVLDRALVSLDASDREVIVLRYFQHCDVRAVAKSLKTTETTAYKRLERAIERLKVALMKRGITSSAAALSLALAERVSGAAPVHLSAVVAGKALFAASATSPAALGLMHFMSIAKTAAALAGLVAILCLPGLGVALYEYNAVQRDEVALKGAQQSYHAAQSELHQLKLGAAAAEAGWANFAASSRGNQTQPTSGAAAGSSASGSRRNSRNPKVDGQDFLSFYPQARQMLREMLGVGYSITYADFYRQAALSPAQIDRLENQAADLWIGNVELREGNINSTTNGTFLPDDRLREILGEQGFQQFQDYDRAMPAHSLADQVAMEIASAGSALSAAQTDQLAAVVTASSPDYQQGQAVNPAALDWQALQTQAKAIIPPPAWPAAQSALLAYQYRTQFSQALAQAPRATVPVNP